MEQSALSSSGGQKFLKLSFPVFHYTYVSVYIGILILKYTTFRVSIFDCNCIATIGRIVI